MIQKKIKLLHDLSSKTPPDSLIDFYLQTIANKGNLNWETLLVFIKIYIYIFK